MRRVSTMNHRKTRLALADGFFTEASIVPSNFNIFHHIHFITVVNVMPSDEQISWLSNLECKGIDSRS